MGGAPAQRHAVERKTASGKRQDDKTARRQDGKAARRQDGKTRCIGDVLVILLRNLSRVARPIKDFKDIVAWQAAMLLVVEVYKLTALLPKDERFGLVMQMRRAAVSVPCNIAEGYGRRSTADYVRFLRVSTASLRELETQGLIVLRLGMVSSSNADVVQGLIERTHHLLAALIRSLKP